MSGTSKFDDLLTHLGTGRWNMLYFLTTSYWCLLVPPQFISGVYLAPFVNYTCVPPDSLNGSVVEVDDDSCSYVRVVEGGTEVEEACTDWDFDTSVFTSTLTSEFSLVCERSHLRATYQSVFMLGTVLSPLLSGYLADRYGRKVVVVVTQVLIIVISITIIFFTNFFAILVMRFFLGASNLLTSYILALEVCEPKHRGTVGILTGLPWALGTMMWGGAAYLIRDWRWLQLAVSLPNLLILPALYLIDESPRWLIVRGLHDRAIQVLRKAARWNRVSLPPEDDLRALMKDIQEESSTQKIASSKVGTEGAKGRWRRWCRPSLPSLLKTRPIQLITLVVCFDYFSVSLVFDGLNMSGDAYSADPFLYLVLSGLVEVPGYSLTAPIIDRWGRKFPTAISYFLCGAVITVLAFIPPEYPGVVMALALAGKLWNSGAFQIIYVYSSELFPTEVRLQGIGAASVSAQLASTFLPFITTILGPLVPWAPSLIFGVVSVVAGVLTMLLRETKGVALPDTIADLSKTTTNDATTDTTTDTTTTAAFTPICDKSGEPLLKQPPATDITQTPTHLNGGGGGVSVEDGLPPTDSYSPALT